MHRPGNRKPDLGTGDTWGMGISKESKGASKGERACYRMHIFKFLSSIIEDVVFCASVIH